MKNNEGDLSRKERLIRSHERIKKHLEGIYEGEDENMSFRDLVEANAVKENPLVRYYKDDLIKFNYIRNYLIHEREIIKDLKEKAVAKFEGIAEKICSPEKILPRFKKNINLFDTGDGLLHVLEYMGNNDYSQVVVNRDGLLSLLTVEGISKWLEREAGSEAIDVKTADVSDALDHEIKDSFICMSSSKSVYAARDAFAKAPENRGSRLFAIIITNTGSRTESPLGIVTPWDLAHIDL